MPITWSPRPSAHAISVADGRNETMRRAAAIHVSWVEAHGPAAPALAARRFAFGHRKAAERKRLRSRRQLLDYHTLRAARHPATGARGRPDRRPPPSTRRTGCDLNDHPGLWSLSRARLAHL